VISEERGGPLAKGRPEGPAAKPDAQRHLTFTDRQPLQLSLFGGEPDYPADGMYPARAWAAAEWHLRFFVNTMPRGRSHWWMADQRRRSA
jgi:hypothetical protein